MLSACISRLKFTGSTMPYEEPPAPADPIQAQALVQGPLYYADMTIVFSQIL